MKRILSIVAIVVATMLISSCKAATQPNTNALTSNTNAATPSINTNTTADKTVETSSTLAQPAATPKQMKLTPAPRQGLNLVVGQEYAWKGTVTGKDRVLVGSEKDSRGNLVEYVADLSVNCIDAKSVISSDKGKQVTVQGVLDQKSRSVITGTDYSYQPDGSRRATTTITTTILFVLKDCRTY